MKKILAVDDANTVLKIVDMTLSDEGYDVKTAPNAEEAKKILQAEKFDLGVFDVNMPGQNGIDLTRDVLLMPNGKDMKIVILTTESSEELKEAGKKAGAVAWLIKPFEGEDLLELVKQLI
ncbi:MAG: response regulator [Leptospiraceae bacterium]|nr:response regulator [Leptospiraceae bacterium]MCK6382037.1 response regulator [Leptospiraceae bacterium]NUM40802.1 response regulator [Leptospiraceae bacterium]